MTKIRKKKINIEDFTPAQGSKLVVFKTSKWKKVETKGEGQNRRKVITAREDFGYPVGRAVLVPPAIYDKVVKKYKIAEDYDAEDPTHLPPHKEHDLDQLNELKSKKSKESKVKTRSTTTSK